MLLVKPRIAELTSQLKESEDRVQQWQSKFDDIAPLLKEYDSLLKDNHQLVEEYQKSQLVHAETVADLNGKISDLSAEITKRGKVEEPELDSEVESLRERIKSLEKLLDEAKSKNYAKIDSESRERGRSGTIVNIEASVRDLENENNALVALIANSVANSDSVVGKSLRDAVKGLIARNSVLEIENTRLSDDEQVNVAELNRIGEILSQKSLLVAELETEMAHLAKAASEKERMAKQLAEMEQHVKKMTAMESERDQLANDEIVNMSKEMEELKQQLAAARMENEKGLLNLSKQEDGFQQELEKLHQRLSASNENASRLESELKEANDTLLSQTVELETLNKTVVDQRVNSEQRLASMDEDLSAIFKREGNLSAERDSLLKQMDRSKEDHLAEVSQLEERLGQMRQQIAAQGLIPSVKMEDAAVQAATSKADPETDPIVDQTDRELEFLSSVQEEVKELTKDYEMLLKEKELMEERVSRDSASLELLEKKNSELHSRLKESQKVKEEREELAKDIERLKTEHAASALSPSIMAFLVALGAIFAIIIEKSIFA